MYRQFEDTSYPYAKYAAEFNVPYGDVLRAADAIKRGERIIGLSSQTVNDIAWLVARERAKQCANAAPLPLFEIRGS